MDLKQRHHDGYEDEEAVLLGSDQSGFLERRRRRLWKIRKRDSNPCTLALCFIIGLWSISALAVTILCYVRLSEALHSQSTVDTIYHGLYMPLTNLYNGVRNSADCQKSLDLPNGRVIKPNDDVFSSKCYEAHYPGFFNYHTFFNGTCYSVTYQKTALKYCDIKGGFNLFTSKLECEGICISSVRNYKRVAAPLGARLMMLGLMLSICLVFAFVPLPFDWDKVRLKGRLRKWLFVNMVLIIVMASITVTGSILVVRHGDRYHIMNSKSLRGYKVYWDVALLLSPMVVFAFHIYFWRQVYFIYDAIDTSKPTLSGVWSAVT